MLAVMLKKMGEKKAYKQADRRHDSLKPNHTPVVSLSASAMTLRISKKILGPSFRYAAMLLCCYAAAHHACRIPCPGRFTTGPSDTTAHWGPARGRQSMLRSTKPAPDACPGGCYLVEPRRRPCTHVSISDCTLSASDRAAEGPASQSEAMDDTRSQALVGNRGRSVRLGRW